MLQQTFDGLYGEHVNNYIELCGECHILFARLQRRKTDEKYLHEDEKNESYTVTNTARFLMNSLHTQVLKPFHRIVSEFRDPRMSKQIAEFYETVTTMMSRLACVVDDETKNEVHK